MVDTCMTITRTEGQRQSIWCTGKGGFLEHKIAMLQGFPNGFLDWQSLGIRGSQFGAPHRKCNDAERLATFDPKHVEQMAFCQRMSTELPSRRPGHITQE
jgi:hypothetical protein